MLEPNEYDSYLGIQCATMTCLLNTQYSFDPSNNFMTEEHMVVMRIRVINKEISSSKSKQLLLWDYLLGFAGLSKLITPYLMYSSNVLLSGDIPHGIGV
jgi:hypothetical protein